MSKNLHDCVRIQKWRQQHKSQTKAMASHCPKKVTHFVGQLHCGQIRTRADEMYTFVNIRRFTTKLMTRWFPSHIDIFRIKKSGDGTKSVTNDLSENTRITKYSHDRHA